jgi:CheY-like chemotaxis protein
MEQEHILVIDDEEGLLQLLKMRLNAMGFTVTACTSGREAVTPQKPIDLIWPSQTSACAEKTDWM